MSIKHIILGILMECPQHGYALKRAILPSVSEEEHLNDGVLYPLLAQMEKERLIRKKIEKGMNALERKVFLTTKKGEKLFFTWLQNEEDEGEEVMYDFMKHQPFLSKSTFFKRLSTKQQAQKFSIYQEKVALKLKRLEEIRKGMIQWEVDETRIMILDLGIAQQRVKLQWVKKRMMNFQKILRASISTQK